VPDPFGAFESSYNVASKGRKPLQGVLDAFDEEQKLKRDVKLEREKIRAKSEMTPEVGVYSWNPLTQAFGQEATVPKGSVVRNTTTPEDLATKYSIRNRFESPTEGEVSKKTIAEGMVGRIQELKMALGDTDEFSGTKIKAALPFGVFNKKAQRFASVQQALADDLLRLKSGAQINEQEYKRLSRLLTKPWRFDEVDIQNLTDFENQFSKLSDRINRGYIWDGSQFVVSGTQGEPETNSMNTMDSNDPAGIFS